MVSQPSWWTLDLLQLCPSVKQYRRVVILYSERDKCWHFAYTRAACNVCCHVHNEFVNTAQFWFSASTFAHFLVPI